MEKASIVKALERARDEIANALNLLQTGVINPGPGTAALAAALPNDDSFGGDWPAENVAPPAEPAKRGRRPKNAPATVAPDADPFAEALAGDEPGLDAAPNGAADDGAGFFDEPTLDAGPTEKMVNDTLVSAITSMVARAKQAGKDVKKTDARDAILVALEKKFGEKDPAKLKPQWAAIIAYFTPKK